MSRLWGLATRSRPPVICKATEGLVHKLVDCGTQRQRMPFGEFKDLFTSAHDTPTRGAGRELMTIEDINRMSIIAFPHSGFHPMRIFVGKTNYGCAAFPSIFAETALILNMLRIAGMDKKTALARALSIAQSRTDNKKNANVGLSSTLGNVTDEDSYTKYMDSLLRSMPWHQSTSKARDYFKKNILKKRSERIRPYGLKFEPVLKSLLEKSLESRLAPFIYTDGSEMTRLYAVIGNFSEDSWYCYGRNGEDLLLQRLEGDECRTLSDIRFSGGYRALILVYPWEADFLGKAEAIRRRGIPTVKPLRKITLGELDLAMFAWEPGSNLINSDDLKAWKEFGAIIRRCHDQGVLHMDVAGRNAIITDQGVKLLDFEHILVLDKMSEDLRGIAKDIAEKGIATDAQFVGWHRIRAAFMDGYGKLH